MDVDLERSTKIGKKIKILQVLIKYQEEEKHGIYCEEPRLKDLNITQEVNARFTQEVLEAKNEIRKKHKNKLINLERNITDLEEHIKEQEELVSSVEGIERSIATKSEEQEIMVGCLQEADYKYSAQENMVARLQEEVEDNKIAQERLATKMKGTEQQISEITSQEMLVTDLTKQIQEGEARYRQGLSDIDGEGRKTNAMRSKKQEIEDTISHIEHECKNYSQNIRELRRKRREAQEKRTKAFKDKRYYAHSAQKIEKDLELFRQKIEKPLRQKIEELRGQKQRLSERIDLLQGWDDVLQQRKKAIANLRFDDRRRHFELKI